MPSQPTHSDHPLNLLFLPSVQVRPKRNIRMAMQNEVSAYAACQKDERGLDKAVEDAKYRMKRYGGECLLLPYPRFLNSFHPHSLTTERSSHFCVCAVTPNLLVIPPQMSLYMALAPDEKISFKDGGPQALAAFEAGAEGFETKAFRGCGIVTSDPFEVSEEQEAVQMLERFTQVGEFYVMTMPDTVAPETPGFMDILLYDEEKDRHVKIGFRRALLATGLFQEGGAPRGEGLAVNANLTPAFATAITGTTPTTEVKMYETTTLKQWHDAAKILERINRTGAADPNELKEAKDASKIASLVLSRPFIEHAMLSAVMAVSGGDTGATVFGPSDMQISVR